MPSPLDLLNTHIFSSMPSKAAYDLIKIAWEKANEQTWEELYVDAFEVALQDERPRLTKYTDGEINLSRDDLHRVLHYDLGAPVASMAISELTDQAFSASLAQALADQQVLTLGGHTLSEVDYAQLVRRLVQHATALFKAVAIQNAFQQAMMDQTLYDHALLQQTQAYLQDRFDLVLVKLDTHTMLLEQIVADTKAIKEGLGLDRPTIEVQAEIQTSIDTRRPNLFRPGGLCAGRSLKPAMNQFFVAQEFSSDRDDLLKALADSLSGYNLQPYRADQDVEAGHILCKIAGKIQTSLFSVFELTRTQNRNIYLELGIAIGLQRPFVLVKQADADVSPLAHGLDYYSIRSYAGMRHELGDRLQQYLLDITSYSMADSVVECRQTSYVLAHGDFDMPPDFCLAVATFLATKDLTPILIGNDNRETTEVLESAGISYEVVEGEGQTRLDAVAAAIQNSKFGVFRVDSGCSADTFLALGMAIGQNRPWRLVSRESSALPSDVRGLSGLQFRDFGELERRFPLAYAG